jgi:two-component system chemotaxis response regulator CheY
VSKTVLIVDDSTSMRQMVAFTLKQAGYTVVEGADGREGLTRLGTQAVNLIITDLNMPVMDGMTFIRGVRGDSKFRFTPILVLTTESQEAKKQQAKAAGATGWLVKPFNPEQLLQVVAKVLP